jgi:tetratricopeptide (TPR) repeat protein
MLWQIIIVVLSLASVASYFAPTPVVLTNAFRSGQTFFVSGDYKNAIAQYDAILTTDNKLLNVDSVKVDILSGEFVLGVRIAAYYQKANALARLQRYDESVKNYRAVEESGDMPKIRALAQYQIYNSFYKLKDYSSAIIAAKKLVEKYPNDEKATQALYDVGWAYKAWGKNDSSILSFQELLNKYPKSAFDAKARFQIGQNYYDDAQWDSSITAFRELSLLYKPENFDSKTWENVELKVMRDRMKFEAMNGKEEEQTNLELVAKASIKIGDAYARQNKYDQALAQFKSVIVQYSLMPTLVEITYVKMADLTLQVKGIDEAVYLYRGAIDENFGKKDLQAKLQFKIAKTLEEQKQFTKSADEYVFYMRAYPDVETDINYSLEQANLNAVLMYYNGNKYQQTIAYCDTFRARFGTSTITPSVLLLEGTSYSALKQYDSARVTLQKLIDDYPDADQRYQAQIVIARSYFDEKRYDRAVPARIGTINRSKSYQ